MMQFRSKFNKKKSCKLFIFSNNFYSNNFHRAAELLATKLQNYNRQIWEDRGDMDKICAFSKNLEKK